MTWPPNVPFTPEHVDREELETIVADLAESLKTCQEWIAKHGFTPPKTVENLLSGLYEKNRAASEWAEAAMEWHASARQLDPRLFGCAEILREASEAIWAAIPNDPSIVDTRPLWIRLPAECGSFGADDSVLDGLRLITTQIPGIFEGHSSTGLRLVYSDTLLPAKVLPGKESTARQPDGPQEPKKLTWHGKEHKLDIDDMPFRLLCFLWERWDEQGKKGEVKVSVPDIGKAVWGDRSKRYGSMRTATSRLNTALLGCEIPLSVAKPRGENVITFG
jgi:hypothetical protein